MVSTESGSLRLFRVAGIQVSLHWTWLLVAVYQLTSRHNPYSSFGWLVAQYLSLFLIVLLHEFGHAFASRQVGGEARDILLWPFGGIAFVKVPPRPTAELWSIAAGPLVNLILVPVLLAAGVATHLTAPNSDLAEFFDNVFGINLGLLIFNLLPVYPLDGGQILRSLLWFPFGRARSLTIASSVGLVCLPLLAALLIWLQPERWLFTALIGLFLAQQCLFGFRHAKTLLALEQMPRHGDFACPTCQQAPPGGPLWLCATCGNRFDPFSTLGVCPHCQAAQAETPCAFCGARHPIAGWQRPPAAGAAPPVIEV